MKYLVLDIETRDPYISRGLGSGWVYKYKNIPNCDYKLLGTAYRDHEGTMDYVTDIDIIRNLIDSHDYIICHNAAYDVGGLLASGVTNIKDKPVIDTEILSRLYDSSLMSHSLDNISKKYLRLRKSNNDIIDDVNSLDLFPYMVKELNAKKKAEKNGKTYIRPTPDPKKVGKWSKENMDIIQEASFDTIAKYAIQDVKLTWDLFSYFKDKIDMKIATKYSSITHVCIDYRARGIKVDLEKARDIKYKMIPIIKEKYDKVYEIAGEEFNINSIKEVPPIFDKLEIDYPLTPTGNPSITTPWMAKQVHPLCKAMVEARQVLKINRDFIQKVLDIQEYTDYNQGIGKYGRVFPELHALRARTGRFSCTGYNMQQIPSRDPVLGNMCRSLFIPEEGEKWFALDFSNQEGRLQIHYAYKLRCPGSDIIVKEFVKNPNLDMHTKVAQLVGMSCKNKCGDVTNCKECKKGRKTAKAINLGVSYGMGVSKLSESLGVSVQEAKIILARYNKLSPYLDTLNKKCSNVLESRGSIKTIGNRHVTIDPPMMKEGKAITFGYKALNKLIQGSAADQTIECMLQAYKEGLPATLAVHDEICMSGTQEQAARLHEIMENSIKLVVPVVVDYTKDGGNSWAECK